MRVAKANVILHTSHILPGTREGGKKGLCEGKEGGKRVRLQTFNKSGDLLHISLLPVEIR